MGWSQRRNRDVFLPCGVIPCCIVSVRGHTELAALQLHGGLHGGVGRQVAVLRQHNQVERRMKTELNIFEGPILNSKLETPSFIINYDAYLRVKLLDHIMCSYK